MHIGLSDEVLYVALLFVLFVVPRSLQRYRIPSAVTALAFGATAAMGFGLLREDPVVELVSALGIVSLFLFAGLDVQASELRKERQVLIEHVVLQGVTLAFAAYVLVKLGGLGPRVSLLTALALFTPSTGFILDSLGRWGLSQEERFWIRSKAIGTELVALAVLFVILQSTSAARLGLSALAIVAMVAVLPAIFRWFASAVLPHAPNSEFGLLMMVAAACGVLTRSLGVYYLVGAFAVGMAAQQFQRRLPAMASIRMIGAVESFASLFVPFYFFHAGVQMRAEDFGWGALGLGLAFTLLVTPLRLGQIVLHRSVRLKEAPAKSLRVGVPMLPTTVFTLVIAMILRDEFQVSPVLFGALIVYTLINTLIPGLLLRAPAAEFADELLLGEISAAAAAEGAAGPPTALPVRPATTEQESGPGV